MICTRLRQGHLSVYVGHSLRSTVGKLQKSRTAPCNAIIIIIITNLQSSWTASSTDLTSVWSSLLRALVSSSCDCRTWDSSFCVPDVPIFSILFSCSRRSSCSLQPHSWHAGSSAGHKNSKAVGLISSKTPKNVLLLWLHVYRHRDKLFKKHFLKKGREFAVLVIWNVHANRTFCACQCCCINDQPMNYDMLFTQTAGD